jgi:hypothetical protein
MDSDEKIGLALLLLHVIRSRRKRVHKKRHWAHPLICCRISKGQFWCLLKTTLFFRGKEPNCEVESFKLSFNKSQALHRMHFRNFGKQMANISQTFERLSRTVGEDY